MDFSQAYVILTLEMKTSVEFYKHKWKNQIKQLTNKVLCHVKNVKGKENTTEATWMSSRTKWVSLL